MPGGFGHSQKYTRRAGNQAMGCLLLNKYGGAHLSGCARVCVCAHRFGVASESAAQPDTTGSAGTDSEERPRGG